MNNVYRNIKILKHIIVWLVIFFYFKLIDPVPGPISARIIGGGAITLNKIWLFYFLAIIVYPKYWKNNHMMLISLSLFSFIIFTITSYYIFSALLPALHGSDYFLDDSYIHIFTSDVIGYCIVAGFSLAYYSYWLTINQQKTQNEQEKNILRKEIFLIRDQTKLKLTDQFLSFLNNQFSSWPEKVIKAINLYTKMLNYSDNIKIGEYISLKKEIHYIEDFIKLQKFLHPPVYVELNIEKELKHIYIMPRILMTFVENAFKHGTYNNHLQPIIISLIVNKDKINFIVKNFIKSGLKKSAGIGIENAKDMLNLYYKDNFNLITDEHENIFLCKLLINITNEQKTVLIK